MGRVICFKYNKSGFMITLCSIIGFGVTIELGAKEKSLSVTLKLWKLHSINSIAIL